MKLNKFILVLFLLLVYFSTIQSHCSKRLNCSETIYSFEIHSKAFPDSDSILINDTIWIEVICSTLLLDKISQTTVDYSGAENLGTDIDFYEFIGGNIPDPGVKAAVSSFEYKLIYGSFMPDNHLPEQNRDYEFVQVGNEYKNTNQHLYFYEQNRPGYTPSEYERTHIYCFKVK